MDLVTLVVLLYHLAFSIVKLCYFLMELQSFVSLNLLGKYQELKKVSEALLRSRMGENLALWTAGLLYSELSFCRI